MDYRQLIPWRLLEQHLQETILQVQGEFENVSDPYNLYRLQGDLSRLRKLLNLPGTLEVKYSKEE